MSKYIVFDFLDKTQAEFDDFDSAAKLAEQWIKEWRYEWPEEKLKDMIMVCEIKQISTEDKMENVR